MAQGTLSLNNGSVNVTGSGTKFTDYADGSFITLAILGVPYTIAVDKVTNDTTMTLVVAFDGPTVSGVAFDVTGVNTMALATMGVTTQAQRALRMLLADQSNWRQIFSDSETITITLPNGQTLTGMSWGYISKQLADIDIDQMIAVKDEAIAAKDGAVAAKDEAAGSATAAAGSASEASGSATAAANSAGESSASAAAAANSESGAASSAASASADADRAEEAANTIDTSFFLRKDQNLQDIPDKAAAWLNVRPIGSTPLSADAVADGDAPRWRQVLNAIGSGTGGPTMNGVMNYHVGEAVQWETRAYYPPNCLPRDGQLVNRADWPELWAWAQMTSPITDSAWLADVTKRGSYSTGDGSTTFRLPDWNGAQSGSIPSPFFRGGTGAADMKLRDSGLPNSTGTFGRPVFGDTSIYEAGFLSGPFGPVQLQTNFYNLAQLPVQGAAGVYPRYYDFDLSRSWAGFGRVSDEVAPRQISGVWLVRASGGFVAANTSWDVINALTSEPGVSTTNYGGVVNSTLKVGTADYGKAGLRTVVTSDASGVKTVGAQIVVTDSTGSSSVQKVIKIGTVDGVTGGVISGGVRVEGSSRGAAFTSGGSNTWEESTSVFRNIIAQGMHSDTQFGLVDYVTNNTLGKAYVRLIPFASQSAFSIFTIDHTGEAAARVFTPTCDERVKDEVERIADPLNLMKSIRGVTFRYKDSGIFGIGFTAQDVEKVFPEAVSVGEDLVLKSGEVVRGIKRPDSYGVAAALHHEAILALMGEIEKLRSEIAELKASK